MHFKKILFVLTFIFVFESHAIANFSFFQKQPNARKTGLSKMGVGLAFITGALGGSDSGPINTVQCVTAGLGAPLLVAGLYQILVDVLAEEEAKSSLYPDTPYFNTAIKEIVTNKQFITGGLFATLGLILRHANENANPSETSFALSIAGLSLMSATVVTQLSKDYLPHIIAFFNK